MWKGCIFVTTKNNRDMKKILMVILVMVSFSITNAQTYIELRGDTVGVLFFEKISPYNSNEKLVATLYRDLTDDEFDVLNSRYVTLQTPRIEYVYSYVYDNEIQRAGRLLYDSGDLKNKSKNHALLSMGSILVGSIAMIANANNGSVGTFPVLCFMTGGVFSISSIIKDYKANNKTKEAGYVLQRY